MPWAAGLKSSTAILAAVTAPGPLMSAYKLDMSFMTPILTLTFWACAAVPNSAAATKARLVPILIMYLPRCDLPAPTEPISNSEIVVQFLRISLWIGGREFVDYPAMLHDVMAVGNRGGELKVLLHQQDRKALRFEHSE